MAKLGSQMIGRVGAALAVLAALAAACAPPSNYPTMAHARTVEQATYLVECGFLLSIFLFAAHFHLAWDRRDFGIALGLSISACVGLGSIAPSANGIFFARGYLLDFLNGATYHVCVLIWFYYLLSPARPSAVLASHCISPPSETSERNRHRQKTLQPAQVLARSKS